MGTNVEDYYTEANHGPFKRFELGRFELEEGGAIDDAFVAYAVVGAPSAARDNVVLVPTWFSGTHAIMQQVYIGEGHALDPSRWCIVLVNQLGSGLSVSPHHGLGDRFPRVRIGDDVRAQERLLREGLGVEELALVVGGSMGGQQTYEWAVRFPDRVRRAAPIAATARIPDLNSVFVEAIKDALTLPNEREANLVRVARLMAVLGFSTEFWALECWRGLGFESADAFFAGFMVPYFAPMDPGNLLCQAWKWQHADVGRLAGGDLPAALRRITAKTYVMPIDTDLFFPLGDCTREQSLIAGSELRTLHSTAGHLALFGFEPEYIAQVDHHLGELLAEE